jgi:RNA polymerase sigma factor (sigma-70 family)
LSDCSEILLGILETHGSRLHALLTRLTLREEVAEDLMQDLFLKLSRSSAFQKADDSSAYAYRSAIHIAFDWRKKQTRHLRIESIASEPAAEFVSPLNEIIQSEEIEEVLHALGRLSNRSREIVVMRYIQQETYERIAELFGKNDLLPIVVPL